MAARRPDANGFMTAPGADGRRTCRAAFLRAGEDVGRLADSFAGWAGRRERLAGECLSALLGNPEVFNLNALKESGAGHRERLVACALDMATALMTRAARDRREGRG